MRANVGMSLLRLNEQNGGFFCWSGARRPARVVRCSARDPARAQAETALGASALGARAWRERDRRPRPDCFVAVCVDGMQLTHLQWLYLISRL